MSKWKAVSTCLALLGLGLALSSCSNPGFSGRTRQFSGVWLYEFEGSTFIEGATKSPTELPASKEADWLEWSHQPRLESLMDKDDGREDCDKVQPFLLTFSGYRTHYPFGGAGHFGQWRSEVTLQKLISAKRLGPSFCDGR